MRFGPAPLDRRALLTATALLAAGGVTGPVWAGPSYAELEGAVVGLTAEVASDARTADTLGTRRQGTAVLIDGHGLALTVGWLVMESTSIELRDRTGAAVAADLVGWDHASGLSLVRATTPIAGSPLRLGSARALPPGSPVLAIARDQSVKAMPQAVAARRVFAGYWEYLLEEAIFTVPAFDGFAGAALVDQEGRLVGIGLLAVGDAMRPGMATPDNMFVPIDEVTPILGDLIATGRRAGPDRGWLGVTAIEDEAGVRVVRVAPESPAAGAGFQVGDVIRSVGGSPVVDLAACWRALWAAGPAGTAVAIEVIRGAGPQSLTATTVDRSTWLRLRPTF